MDLYKSLPEPAMAGVIGAGLGAGAAMLMDEGVSTMSFAVSQGLLAGAAAYIAPMLPMMDDKMKQPFGAAVVGGAAGYAAPAYVAGGALTSAAISGGALYICRAIAS